MDLPKGNPTSVSYRQNMATFLDSNIDGRRLKLWHAKHGHVKEDMIEAMVHLLISREISIIFEKNEVSLDNPLKQLK